MFARVAGRDDADQRCVRHHHHRDINFCPCPAGEADGQMPTAVREGTHRAGALCPADRVEDQVNPLSAGDLAQRLRERLPVAADAAAGDAHVIGAEGAAELLTAASPTTAKTSAPKALPN